MFGINMLAEDEHAEDVDNGGMKYIVLTARWEQIEQEQDEFNSQFLDNFYNDVLEPNDLSCILIVRTGQCWATDNSYDPELGVPLSEFASTPPLDYDDYYQFIYTIVEYLKGKIDFFVIENDFLTLQSWYGTPEEYVQLCGVAYQAAKAANPHCVIIGNKFPAMGFSFLIARELYESGAHQEAIDFWNGYSERRSENYQVHSLEELLERLNSDFGLWTEYFADVTMTREQAQNMDVIGYNYYLHYDFIDEVIGWFLEKMEVNGFYRPLFDLEHGVKDDRLVVSDEVAAQELVKGYVITQSLGVRYISWYPFSIDTTLHNADFLKPMYDLYEAEYFPAYYAMQNLSEHISKYHFFESVEGYSYSRYRFKSVITEQADIEVVWADGSETTLNIPFPPFASRAFVTNYTGSETIVYEDTDTLRIDVGIEPKFIKWQMEGSGRKLSFK
jgi:hypothetical protein